jgi:hypothetical protein
MLPLCDLESLCGVSNPLFSSSLTQKISFQLLRLLFRVWFKDPYPITFVKEWLLWGLMLYSVLVSSRYLTFRICLILNMLRLHGLVTILAFFLKWNLEVFFHTTTPISFPLWSFSLFKGELFFRIISSSHYVNHLEGTKRLSQVLLNDPVCRVLPFKESVLIWSDFTPTRKPILFWGSALLEFALFQE